MVMCLFRSNFTWDVSSEDIVVEFCLQKWHIYIYIYIYTPHSYLLMLIRMIPTWQRSVVCFKVSIMCKIRFVGNWPYQDVCQNALRHLLARLVNIVLYLVMNTKRIKELFFSHTIHWYSFLNYWTHEKTIYTKIDIHRAMHCNIFLL